MNKGLALVLAAVLAAGSSNGGGQDPAEPTPGTGTGPRVTLERVGAGWTLVRDGVPYRPEGAGLSGGDAALLAAHGGNSYRTWSIGSDVADARRQLDRAHALGLTVAMCLEVGKERHGFDYDDAGAVAAQLARLRAEVTALKDHPALLAWIIGNEPNLEFRNPKVFDAIDGISQMIHAVDGRHPTTTALAGFSAELAGLIETRAPDLDFVSVQFYGGLVVLPGMLADIGWDKPVMVTEWGTVGHWEMPLTSWGAPIELDSSAKADFYRESYEKAIAAMPGQVIGSYAFLWGQKQERTPTWYGMFLADGSETEAVDVMHYLWTGAWPENRAPRVTNLLLASRSAGQDVTLAPGTEVVAGVDASDPDADSLDFEWLVMRESTATSTGGDPEAVPEAFPGLVTDTGNGSAAVTAPAEPGAYRLFVYVRDGEGNAGHANLPFQVPEERR
ncbi:MAG TPA: hypothetical protein VFY03_13280 [Woeseiaceae bacterium]|nr:hypothetical protein [Woeseiaceae bacterium]